MSTSEQLKAEVDRLFLIASANEINDELSFLLANYIRHNDAALNGQELANTTTLVNGVVRFLQILSNFRDLEKLALGQTSGFDLIDFKFKTN